MNRQVTGGNAASIWNISSGLLSAVQPGHIKMIGSEGVTPGYLECMSQAINIVDYPELFAEVGFTWGQGTAFHANTDITTLADVAGNARIMTVNTVADVAGSLNNTYWYLNSAYNQFQYYVWYNVSGGGTDPLVPFLTGIMVAINTNDTDAAVATATASAVSAAGGGTKFTAGAITNQVTITNQQTGPCTTSTDGGTPTGFAFNTTQLGTNDSLDGKYFWLFDSAGSVAVWIQVSGFVPAPSVGANRYLPVVVAQGAADTVVASDIAAALAADGQFTPSTSTGNIVHAENTDFLAHHVGFDGNTGFGPFTQTQQGGIFQFYLPPSGVFYRSWDHGVGNDPDRASRTGMNGSPISGDHVGTYQGDENIYHYHPYGAFAQRAGGGLGVDQGNNFGTTYLTYPSGGNESRPVNANVMYMIKY